MGPGRVISKGSQVIEGTGGSLATGEDRVIDSLVRCPASGSSECGEGVWESPWPPASGSSECGEGVWGSTWLPRVVDRLFDQ